ncbi:hypothetical protein F6X40_09510 [Paraburkholderia sp. UCT31]|uniref:hypothetical protein n=1 Tax=Paraburkholderia sp. UCT31 TaxID=2615209 RepID=UPI00165634D6|nr:hypothetical protein [Paraburkholderia sp. UCT31]MBC8737045.1 hypothetical protein [Paraburkholderia sp. UCT31]
MRHFSFFAATLIVAGTCAAAASTAARAESFQAELRIDGQKPVAGLPNDVAQLDFADGSGRHVALVRQSGRVVSPGALAGATAQDWGFHEVVVGRTVQDRAHGYLVISRSAKDVLYLRTHTREADKDGRGPSSAPLYTGTWRVTGGSGSFRGLWGTGTLSIKSVSATERQWILEGEMGPAQPPAADKKKPAPKATHKQSGHPD